MKNASRLSAVKVATAAGLLFGTTACYADVDVSKVLAALAEAGTTVATVGAAALGVVVVVKVFKYIRSAF